MKAYAIYNYMGKNKIFSFVELADETIEEIEIEPATDMSIKFDYTDVPYLIEDKTGIIYDISRAEEGSNGALVVQRLNVDMRGNIVPTNGKKTIARIIKNKKF